MSKIIGILGSGIVGTTLANGLFDLGYSVSIGNRKGTPVNNWGGDVSTYSDISAKADTLILAVKGTAAEAVITSIKDHLDDKTAIDTTNPIAENAPDEGVLSYFTTINESLMERLHAIAPKANFVKAFNSAGAAYMVKPQFKDGQPTMFICGNNNIAKNEVATIRKQLGWELEDCGGIKSARAIEPLCILWCILGMLHNNWSHAFKLLRA